MDVGVIFMIIFFVMNIDILYGCVLVICIYEVIFVIRKKVIVRGWWRNKDLIKYRFCIIFLSYY